MHHYQHHIGDYRRDTMHLTLLEHGVYRQLLDMYYLAEQPISLETQTVFRGLCARTQDEQNTVEMILKEFFTRTEKGWVHNRCDREIGRYQSKCDHNREAGKLGGRPKKTQTVILENRSVSKTKPKKTLTNNQEPLTNISTTSVVDKGDCCFADGLDVETWRRWVAYRRSLKKPIKPVSVESAQRELAGYGSEQAAVVERSIANGWQGLFPLNGGSNGKNGSSRTDRIGSTIAELTGANRNSSTVIDGYAKHVD